MTNPYASGDEQWTVPDGLHQPEQEETFPQSMATPHAASTSQYLVYEHWGVFKGDWRGFPVLCFNVSVSDRISGPIPSMDSHTLAVELPVVCPLLSISPATALRPVRRLFGFGGTRFGHDGFDRRFQVDTSDKEFARRVLGPATTSWLLEHPVAAANPFRFEGVLLLMSNSGIMGPPEIVAPKLQFLCELYTRVPPGCWTADT
ncbi:hypothetical protein [Stackebrandtia nassauensis]|uniref:Uncharacterized protein n=1 Tax=Stackebrandtia nassauensis (strain DSM 44728 / CIP 108903 / NRRL B-16338 / NBRC 102104 / LLR-40K-21) TaxID=446470 RepID=D3Q929_STANL|nr:hypothetical protein [Stackebrandtia nassauensis]ADD40638.1 hypothetical protein Snas_0927 [Stackebrandtia nassauensis DSM 44728]